MAALRESYHKVGHVVRFLDGQPLGHQLRPLVDLDHGQLLVDAVQCCVVVTIANLRQPAGKASMSPQHVPSTSTRE